MLRTITNRLGMLVAAIILALISAWWLVLHPPAARMIVHGPWRMNAAAGGADADMYSRARVAIGGLFALNRTEAIYFEATEDDDGQPLRARCSYIVTGRPVAARWWSVTAYADDNFLIPNPAQRFSYNMDTLAQEPDGTFRILASPMAQAGNWLPTGAGDGGFNLLFRLYNPAPEIAADPAAAPLPSIERAGACP
jgi:hypothetical protein